MSLKALHEIPEKVSQTSEILTALDRCFLIGFGRLGPDQQAALASLARIFAGTPLEKPISASVAALAQSEFIDKHFVAVACARAALQAAQYDALRQQANAALSRPTPPTEPAPVPSAPPPTGPLDTWQESARNWLMELALAGFQQIEPQTLLPFLSTLEQLQGEPRALRLSALLTGFLNELLNALPISALPSIPLSRWVDLLTRGLLAAAAPPVTPTGRKVSGQFTFLGADLHTHGFFVSCDFYGLLEEKDAPPRTTRFTLSGYKVDVVDGADLWACLPAPVADDATSGISGHQIFQIDDMTLLPGGDLLWDGKAKAKGAAAFVKLVESRFAPGATDAACGVVTAASDRHPVQLAEPVYLPSYTVDRVTSAIDLGDVKLPIAIRRISSGSELQLSHIETSKSLFGLLRFDGGQWEIQPLAVVTDGKKPELLFTGGAASAARGKKSPVLAILRERASRLLRKKS
jgi:hypothetical protein